MAGDPVDVLVGELEAWTKHNATAGNVEDAELVLELLLEHVTADPGELAPGDLDELLLERYPSLVTVLAPTELGDVVPSTRDLVAFLAATGRIRPELVDPLRKELDDIEPRFVDAVMDPDNWGPTKAVTQAMVAAGVDVTDELAVMRWMNEHHPEMPVFDDDGEEDEVDVPENLAEVLGLPDRLPALRLPPDQDLAAAARRSGLLRQASELARWVGGGRAVIGDEELDREDTRAAAQVLGIAVPEGVADMTDLPDLVRLWDLAVDVGLVTVESGSARGEPDRWPSGGDDDALDAWALGFDVTVSGLYLDAQLAGEDELNFEGAGAVCLALFLERATGLPRAELGDLVRADATDGLDPQNADSAWTGWVEAHGDPVSVLLDRLADHGALQFEEDMVHLSPLGLWVMWQELTEGGIEIPLLPPASEMTAVDLLAAAEGLAEQELDDELQAWLASRDPESAAAELLDAAAAGDPADRLFAVHVVKGLGERAAPQWRGALDRPELRAYAKIALTNLAGTTGHEAKPTVADLGWLATDLLAVSDPEHDLAADVRAVLPAGTEQEVLDVMWRTGHPQAVEVLTMLGKHHPDRKVAKAARTAAFKASSRQG